MNISEARKFVVGFLLLSAVSGLIFLGAKISTAINTAVQIGGDEHFEVNKALLWAHGYPLYTRVWNDQPPLYTVFLGTAFKSFAPTIGVARGVASCFGLLMVGGFFFLVKKQCGLVTGILASICLLACPHVLELSVSAMLEVPTIGAAIWSLLAMLCWSETRKSYWLIASGMIFAVALQIKLTAVVMFPAMAFEMMVTLKEGKVFAWKSALVFLIWAGSAAAMFFVINIVFGTYGYHLLLASHFSHESQNRNYAFDPRLLFEYSEILYIACAGIAIAVFRRDRRVLLPLVLLLTVLAIHLRHRPWWYYYQLHFAIPLAWLAGYAAVELFRFGSTRIGKPGRYSAIQVISLAMGAFTISELSLGGLSRIATEASRINSLPRIEDYKVIAKMREHTKDTRWVFGQNSIFPFEAGFMQPPELAVLPLKRFWAGAITDQQILALVKRYQPEQLLIDVNCDNDLKIFADSNYKRAFEDAGYTLYIKSEL